MKLHEWQAKIKDELTPAGALAEHQLALRAIYGAMLTSEEIAYLEKHGLSEYIGARERLYRDNLIDDDIISPRDDSGKPLNSAG